VVLFDEIEKAHQDVFNLLLQILDDGRLTDGHGRTVDFKNTILIMTSNVGSQWIQELGAREEEEMRKRVMEALRAHFRPEFLNRIDEIVIFHSLSMEHIKQIVEIQLSNLRRRLAERKLDIQLTEPAEEFLAKEGFDPVYGARPLKRAIQRLIQDPLSLKVLQGEFKEGDFIEVALKGNELTFRRREG
jgi:ATP-dependent Clp protease ATP-binding subunit ClpB